MHLQARSVTGLDDVSERVEGGVVGGIVERGLDTLCVERVAAPAHLDDQRVDVRALCSRDEVVRFARRTDAFMKGVHPERPQLRGCVLRR